MSEKKNNNTPAESQDGAFRHEIVRIENAPVDARQGFGHVGRRSGKTAAMVQEITGKYNEARRAVHIAATVMDAAGLCRYESPRQCRRTWPPSRETCVKCIENWLISKARKELQDA